jgi:uncharacterized protein YbaR (Trm112 family)
MTIETINKLCCPFDKSDLQLTIAVRDLNDNVFEGYLLCAECRRLYPIVKGIPIMNPDEYREFSLEQPLIEKWNKHLKDRSFDNFRLHGKENQEDPERNQESGKKNT